MKIAYITFVLIHGLIHLLGFVKAFGLKEVKELTLPITKPMGILWFCATALFLLYGTLYFFKHDQSWLLGLVAGVVSQFLIFYFWKDAKFGTIPNLMVLIVAMIGLGASLLQSEFTNRVKNDFAINNSPSTEILTENDIIHLPLAVKNYLRYTKCIGKPKVKNFRVELVGGMRSNPGDDYMSVRSVQYNFCQNPSRYFFMKGSKMGLPATGLHFYQDSEATFQVKLLNWFNVVDAKGDKMTQGETVTLFNDMCIMAPSTLIDKRITWEEIDEKTVKAIFKNNGIEIAANLYFNEKHELVNFTSNDRFETDGKEYINSPWATPLSDYKIMNGFLLPTIGKLIYHRAEVDFIYGELEIKNIQYNLDNIDKNVKIN